MVSNQAHSDPTDSIMHPLKPGTYRAPIHSSSSGDYAERRTGGSYERARPNTDYLRCSG
jgi:hypothetical protein